MEGLAEDVTKTDLSHELRDYEERREMDRKKLEAMVRYCRTAKCRTRMLREYFGEKVDDDYVCAHCDNESRLSDVQADLDPRADALEAPPVVETSEGRCDPEAGEEVTHSTFGRGIVLAINGDRAEIDFGGHGIRTVRCDFLTACS